MSLITFSVGIIPFCVIRSFLAPKCTEPVTTAIIATQASFDKNLTTESTSTSSITNISNTTTRKFCDFKIDQRQVCLEFIGENKISGASSLCDSKQGKLPLPTNEQENADYLNAFITVLKELGQKRNTMVVLDANDVKSEENFVTSTGNPVEWFNWKEGSGKNVHADYVVMFVLDENFTDSVYLQYIKLVGWLDQSASGEWMNLKENAVTHQAIKGIPVNPIVVFCEH